MSMGVNYAHKQRLREALEKDYKEWKKRGKKATQLPSGEVPEIGSWYWVPDCAFPNDPGHYQWEDRRFDKADLLAGLCYRTKRDAIARAKAMRMTEEGR